MGKVWNAALWATIAAGAVGPRVYQLALHPELTEAQLLLSFWWAYAIAVGAACVLALVLRKSTT